jgi:anaerobic selenocysteine-containing dehydrogenase
LATVTDGKLVKVTGDPDNPMFKGYTCAKGRALPEIHNNPKRLHRGTTMQSTPSG